MHLATVARNCPLLHPLTLCLRLGQVQSPLVLFGIYPDVSVVSFASLA